MKKGQVFEGVIEKVAFPNKGHITVDGKTVIVKNGVPGQKVRFSVNKVRSGRAEGRILEVLEKSPLECEPVCPHFADCGGCTYQNLSYEEQLNLKETQVKELLDGAIRDFGYEYVFEGIKESPNHYDYRNKMEFSFGDEVKDGPLALGMHKRGSFYDIVTVDGCRLTDGDFRKILRATLDYFTELGTPFYRKLQHTGYLRHLLVRKAARTGQILVSLVTTSQMDADLEGWKETLLKLPLEGSFAGILHTTNDSLADVVQSDRTEVLYGEEYFYEELLGLRFRISTFSFFQTNSLGAEVLYDTARSYVGDTKDQVIFDLYSGTGTIAQMLAPVAKKVIGVEIVEEAVKAAGENAKLNGLTNCEFIAGDVLKMLDTISDRPDFIVLDPPRDGIHPKALKKIIDYGVDRMIYISCKPTSLARDLEMLQGYGYRVERACCVDMFPWSANVETVVLLSHKKADSYIHIDVEFGEGEGKIPVDSIAKRAEAYKPKEKVTYKMIKEYIEAKYGFKVHTAYIAEVKRNLGLPMYDAPNAVEELKQPRKHPTPEKVEAIKDALRYFAVI
ncbi:23S rRNA (uracil(1939)-C(5))-methyltransferase RlmD [Clostridiaceae bacterium AF29-16BH]|nr:23S rRNA (uracil(1939)-C(5))-methyltransferase RlmD [Clostridiaceae bacterium AF29-16BH]